jgi:hypothetical protein
VDTSTTTQEAVMIINTYATEQIAASHRRDAERAGAASRLAREVRGGRGRYPVTSPTARGASSTEPFNVQFPRPRRWFRNAPSSVR